MSFDVAGLEMLPGAEEEGLFRCGQTCQVTCTVTCNITGQAVFHVRDRHQYGKEREKSMSFDVAALEMLPGAKEEGLELCTETCRVSCQVTCIITGQAVFHVRDRHQFGKEREKSMSFDVAALEMLPGAEEEGVDLCTSTCKVTCRVSCFITGSQPVAKATRRHQ